MCNFAPENQKIMMKMKKICMFCFLQMMFLPSMAEGSFELTDTSRVQNLDEVVVVSQPKESTPLRLQPISSSMFSADDMNRLALHDLSQLSQYVPSFTMPSYGSRLTSSMYVRGIGSRINNPAVGVYYDNIPLMSKAAFNNHFYISSGSANVMGNVCSILDKDNYDTMTRLGRYALQGLFQGCTGLIDASQMVMKAGNVSANANCCGHMFEGCSDLTKGAEFFLTSVGNWSMEYVYRYCSSLSEVYIHYTGSWNTYTMFQGWMEDVSSSGVIYTDNTYIPSGNTSGCPSGWTTQNFS